MADVFWKEAFYLLSEKERGSWCRIGWPVGGLAYVWIRTLSNNQDKRFRVQYNERYMSKFICRGKGNSGLSLQCGLRLVESWR